jgi:hypothetical protein
LSTWLAAGTGYEVTVDDGKVVARNASGRRLRTVPAALKADPAVERLRQLVAWLDRHDRDCGAEVERWMIRSLPVTRAQLTAVWPDAAWRSWLTDLVVRPDGDGPAGLLREVDPGRGAGVVTVDGDTVWLDAAVLRIPHPVLLDDLDDLRELALDLGVQQRLAQLLRETWAKGGRDPVATRVEDYAGGRYDQLRQLTGRAASLGYQVRGGFAVCPVWEHGGRVEARVWVGADDPLGEAETGELVWVRDSDAVPLADVGPVSFSEGMRLAAGLWAGRKADDEDAEQ